MNGHLFETDHDVPARWGPVHAFRALGQLQAVEAMDALMEARKLSDERGGDWFSEEMPLLMGMMGPGALPALTANLRDPSVSVSPRWNSAEGIAEIAERHPEVRTECVALLAEQLERLEQVEPFEDIETLRGGIIWCLVDLKANEAAPQIERAFASGADESLVGDWEEVRYELGLGPKPAPRSMPSFPAAVPFEGSSPPSRTPKQRAKERNRRKLAKQSKKKNRKKKK